MNTMTNLKELERQAFRSTYQDGLWDIYYGLIVVSMALFMSRPETGYTWVNIVLMTVVFAVTYGLFRAGKKFITAPRLGNVVFGEIRKQKKRTMSVVLGVLIFIQVILLLLTALGLFYSPMIRVFEQFAGGRNELLFVSLLGAVIVCTGMSITAFFSDFLRGYYIAFLMALAVFLMLFYKQPVFPVIIGTLIILPGIMLLIRFLRKYPLARNEQNHE